MAFVLAAFMGKGCGLELVAGNYIQMEDGEL